MIESFILQFTKKSIGNIIKLKNEYFLVDKELAELNNNIKLDPYLIGVYLGAETKKGFTPSPALIEELSKYSKNKISINKKAEVLFTCGRDLFGRSIIKSDTKEGIVFVQNEKDENLGYGKVISNINIKDKVVVKNLLDKGHYLRIEMD